MAELMSTLAEVTLASGMEIVLEAINPTTGAVITGVTVTNFAIYGDVPGGDAATPPIEEEVAPLFVPLPQE